ncbi:conserved hypothetical protein, secreted [Christiangramia forsetii KT0803]|uniref:DUF2059 domain-containing protein n=2 Tax=Christiangramia forsetii TaxID=411153 RepID=A0M341_CHRFK|nr:conserved hypothetical protein, secreted [Christiangramia forsetii KT0803]
MMKIYNLKPIMKKIIFTLSILAISLTSFAQEADSFEGKAVKLIKLTAGQQFDIMTEPIVEMVPEEDREAFKKELAESTQGLYKKMATVYTESFTEEEIDEILEFYATPIGKKMVAVTPELTKKGMEIGQAWGMELQPLMAKYMK